MDVFKLLESGKEDIDSAIRKYIPEKFDREYLEWALGKARYSYSIEALQKALAEPIWDLLKRGGKRWRPFLYLLMVEALGGDTEKYKDLSIIIEVIHEGTLIIDDIEDQSETRRGEPCIHKKFGIDISINAGNAMYFLPLLVLFKNKEKFTPEILNKAYEIYAMEMINISCGQATDIAWHKGLANSDNISEEEYLQMCAYKTGCLARMSAKLGALVAGAGNETIEKTGKLAESIGVGFQIQDDILSASGREFQKKKGYGDDITEGKRTLIVIHALKNLDETDRKRLIYILNMHTRDETLIREALSLLKKRGSVEYAKEFGRNLVMRAWAEAEPCFKESEAKEKLKEFVKFAVERDI